MKSLTENLNRNDSLQSQLQQTNATDSDNVQLSKKRKLENAQLIQFERAKQVVENCNISLDLHLKTFTVMGISGQARLVTLHPKESCSCPSNTTCYHILAARLSIGETGNNGAKKKINLKQLYKNARGKKEKRSGRKKPRLGD